MDIRRWHRLFGLTIILGVSACSLLSPVVVHDLGGEMFLLSAHGNTFSSRKALQEKLMAKANRLCDGAPEFVGAPDFEVLKNQTYVNGRWMDVSSLRFAQKIRCMK